MGKTLEKLAFSSLILGGILGIASVFLASSSMNKRDYFMGNKDYELASTYNGKIIKYGVASQIGFVLSAISVFGLIPSRPSKE